MSNNRHLIFSDESGWDKDNRFGSLAKVSGKFEHTKDLNTELRGVLDTHNKKDFKFKDINSNRELIIAKEFIDISFSYLKTSKIKIHVLVWDKHDKRHHIANRDDTENLKRMYFKNLKVVKKHWNINTEWDFYPDEFTAIDWNNDIVKYLQNRTLDNPNETQLELFEAFNKVKINYKNVKELESKEFPIIQLADLYAGLIRTSRHETERFSKWYANKKHNLQEALFDIKNDVEVSKSMLPKFEVMYRFKQKADKEKLGLNFSENKYFKTFHHKKNLFIWHYEPQSDNDKAPIKKSIRNV